MMIDMIFDWVWRLDWWPFVALLGFVWAPKTWTPGELVSAAAMNTNIRDHLNESLRVQTTALTGTQNNFALEGPFAYLQCTNASALTITGALVDSGNVNGARIFIEAIGKKLTFRHQSTGSTTTNRFITPNGGDFIVSAFERALAIYDGANERWRITRAGTNAIATETTALTGTQNDFAINDPVIYLTCTNATALVLTGIGLASGNIDGARVLIEALDADVTLNDEDAGSTATNRFTNDRGVDFTLVQDERALLVYDGANSRWRAAKLFTDAQSLLGVGYFSGAGNVDAAETELTGYGFTIPANFLADGDQLELIGTFTLAANGNTKTLKLYPDGTDPPGTIYTGADNQKVGHFSLVITRRTSSTAAMTGTVAIYTPAGTAVVGGVNTEITNLDFTVDQIAKLTGQGTASDDIKMTEFHVRHFRGKGSIV